MSAYEDRPTLSDLIPLPVELDQHPTDRPPWENGQDITRLAAPFYRVTR